jgi:hypothetical protein
VPVPGRPSLGRRLPSLEGASHPSSMVLPQHHSLRNPAVSPSPRQRGSAGASEERTRPHRSSDGRYEPAPAPAGIAAPVCHPGAWGPPSVGTSDGYTSLPWIA